MARIVGVDLPREKHIWVGLTYIYGIGRTTAYSILDRAQVEPATKVQDLTEDEVNRIREAVTAASRWKATCAGKSSKTSDGSLKSAAIAA